MSSGWNGITIPNVGRTRIKLAAMLCERTGWLFEPHELQRTNPNVQHFEDCCSWDTWAVVPTNERVPFHKVHFFSWCPMGEAVRNGFTIDKLDHSDFEIFPYDTKASREVRQAKCVHDWREKVLRTENFGVQWGTMRICFICGLRQIADDTRSWGAAPWKTI